MLLSPLQACSWQGSFLELVDVSHCLLSPNSNSGDLFLTLVLTNLATFSTIVGGVISDIYHAKNRNIPMSCFSGSVFFGTGLGPLITGFIAHRTNWRWIHYSVAIMSFCLLLILFFFLKETRGNVLLSRKANALNRYYEALESAGCEGVIFEENMTALSPTRRIRWKVREDEERRSILEMLSFSSIRPFRE